MKLNQIINLHKGLTVFVVAALMLFYKNYSIAAWVYLSLHGTYGILWLLKEKIFPDPYFKEKINFITSITGFIFLGSYWIAPFILISSQKSVTSPIIAASISINIIGVFLHFASDAQKYFTLRIQKELIRDGFFKNIRNTNNGDTKPNALNLLLKSDCSSFFSKGVPSAALSVSGVIVIHF